MKEDIKDLFLNNVDSRDTFTNYYDLLDHLDYSGGIHEIIDSNIDIYYYDLRKWAVDNYEYIDQALDEGIAEGVTDFHKLIQIGQFVMLSDDARECVEELYKEYDGKLFNVKGAA